MKRYCLTIDLVDDPELIEEYEKHHKEVWPEVEKSFHDSGILNMEIYRTENRLFMILDVGDDFSFDKKEEMDSNNPIVREWEELMWKYQQALPGSLPSEKWRLMKKIYSIDTSF